MNELPREFYWIDELAEMCNASANELYQMAASGALVLSYSFVGKFKGVLCTSKDIPSDIDIDSAIAAVCDGPDRYHSGYVNLFQSEAREVAAHYQNPDKTFSTTIIKTILGNVVALSQPFDYSINDLFVLSGEVDRIKTKYPNLFKSAPHSQSFKLIKQKANLRHRFNTPTILKGTVI